MDQERASSSAFSHLICSEVRECLKLDPDHKQCYSHYKQVRKLNKQILSAEALIQEQRWVCVGFDFHVPHMHTPHSTVGQSERRQEE